VFFEVSRKRTIHGILRNFTSWVGEEKGCAIHWGGHQKKARRRKKPWGGNKADLGKRKKLADRGMRISSNDQWMTTYQRDGENGWGGQKISVTESLVKQSSGDGKKLLTVIEKISGW